MTTDFITYLVKASICQGICYLFYWIFLRKETSFQFNRLYILAVLALSVVIPLPEMLVDKPMLYLPQPISTPALDYEALQAAQVASVPWKPETRNGKAQASQVLITFGFYLTD